MADSHNTECVAAYLESRIQSLNWFALPNTFVWPRMSGNEVITMMVALVTRLNVKDPDSEWSTIYVETITSLWQHTLWIRVVINSFIYVPHCCYGDTNCFIHGPKSSIRASYAHLILYKSCNETAYLNHIKSQVTIMQGVLVVCNNLDTYTQWGAEAGIFCAPLTHWGLVTPHGDSDLGQHWLR